MKKLTIIAAALLTAGAASAQQPTVTTENRMGELIVHYTTPLKQPSLDYATILTPMLCGVFLKAEKPGHGSEARTSGFYPKLLHAYDICLQAVFRHQKLMLFVAVASLAVTGLLFVAVAKGFFPIQDNGIIQGVAEAPQQTSFQAMRGRQQDIADLLLTDPCVKTVSFFVGVDGQNPSVATSRLSIALTDLGDRSERAPAIAARLMDLARERLPGIELYLN